MSVLTRKGRIVLYTLFANIIISLMGCVNNGVVILYERLLKEPNQENVDALSRKGMAGATMLIGWLELDTSYGIYDKGNEYYIIISAIGLSGREEDSDGNAPRMVRPTETKRVNLIISNDVILRWAMDNRKALLFK